VEAGVAHPAEDPSIAGLPASNTAHPRKDPFVGRELDHRLANSLQLATDFLLFEQMRIGDPAARAALAEAAARLSAVGQMHRFLSAQGETAAVAFEPFLQHLAGFIAGSTGLACAVDADPWTLKGETAQQIAIVINELAINAAKHAYGHGSPGAFHIVARVRGDRLRLTLSDEGSGLDAGPDTGRQSGLGMSIVRAIVRQLGATLDTADDHGAVFTLLIPLPSSGLSRSFAPRSPQSAGG
jgi:two-component sensor histidine kinase